MEVREVQCKSLLNPSKIGDYCINPYIGCQHACVYCYADYLTRRIYKKNEEWGRFVEVKINSPKILRNEIRRKKRGLVYLSSLTDPYQPLESKYELTRKCLKILLEFQFPVTIQTKSWGVIRDLDLLKKFKECDVGFTITTLEEKHRKKFEPFSSPVGKKLEAINLLKDSGIKVYVFFGPILPFISDNDLESYFKLMHELKVDFVYVDKLSLKPGLWDKIKNFLEKEYPELVKSYEKILFGKSNYFEKLKKKIYELSKFFNLKCIFCY